MTFSYRRNLVPMLSVFLGLALVETIVVHILVAAYWGMGAAIVCGLVDLSLVVTLVALLRSIGRRPILLDGSRLAMRTGFLRAIEIPIADIAGFREHWRTADLKAPGVLNLALLAWPSVMIDLARPVMRRGRPVTAVAHCLDDPAGFRAAIEAARNP